jgi:hypothetical protein
LLLLGRQIAENLNKFAEVRRDIFGGDAFEVRKKVLIPSLLFEIFYSKHICSMSQAYCAAD